MRTFTAIGNTSTVIAFVVVTASCGEPGSKIPNPLAPSGTSVQIAGPDSVAPGGTAQFTALVTFSDGTTKRATSATNLRWRSANTSLLQVAATGVASAGQARGATVLTAEWVVGPPSPDVRRSTREVLVLPDGTFRLVGKVTEVEFPTVPVIGAVVEVTPGGLTTTTNFNGDYVLYGVPPDATIRITAVGYQPHVQPLQLASHSTRHFQLALAGPRQGLAGSYTLTIDVETCSGSFQLLPSLRSRSYLAVLTQTGPNADVLLVEPRYRLNSIDRGNRFSGRVDGGGARFTLEQYDYYYPYYGPTSYPNVAEALPDGTFLVPQGTAVVTGTRAGLSGTITGSVDHWDSRFPFSARYLGGCFGAQRFTMTPR